MSSFKSHMRRTLKNNDQQNRYKYRGVQLAVTPSRSHHERSHAGPVMISLHPRYDPAKTSLQSGHRFCQGPETMPS